eukprot:4749106-Pyramimonas_sp.AAC.1
MARDGPALPCRIALVQIKGDWMELCSALGFPNWQTKYTPCIFCKATRDELYQFSSLTSRTHEWGTYADG